MHLFDFCIFLRICGVFYIDILGHFVCMLGVVTLPSFGHSTAPRTSTSDPKKDGGNEVKHPQFFFEGIAIGKLWCFFFFSKRNHGGFERNHTLQKFNSEFSPEKKSPHRVSRFGKDHLPTLGPHLRIHLRIQLGVFLEN